MKSSDLDSLISEFDSITPDAPIFGGVTGSSWGEIWGKAKEIQNGFRGIRYPNQNKHQEAWDRFNTIRDRASVAHKADRENIEFKSNQHRSEIIGMVRNSTYSQLQDLVFFFDPTSKETMKQFGRTISEAGKRLSNKKTEMLHEHKQECFEAISEAREINDKWWERYKEQNAAKQAEWESNQRNWRAKQDAFRDRLVTKRSKLLVNIDRNRQKISGATDALERQRSNADNLRTKIAEAWSDDFKARHVDWLSEAIEKIEDIENSIERHHKWIEEDEQALEDIERKLDELD